MKQESTELRMYEARKHRAQDCTSRGSFMKPYGKLVASATQNR